MLIEEEEKNLYKEDFEVGTPALPPPPPLAVVFSTNFMSAKAYLSNHSWSVLKHHS